jgi:hypothetical protein
MSMFRPEQRPEPRAWGWSEANAGRMAHVAAAPEYQGTTTQLCGLYPFTAGSGSPAVGTPVGRHMLWGEVVCLDPIAWFRNGLVTNTGMFFLGEPGIGKSTLTMRLATGAVATGTTVLILGDTKPDYAKLTRHLGGQVIRIGRGLERINPLDAGPLGTALARMSGHDADTLRWEVRSRRIALLMALCTLVRGGRLGNAEEVILGRAIDLLDARGGTANSTIPDVLKAIAEGPAELRASARAGSDDRHGRRPGRSATGRGPGGGERPGALPVAQRRRPRLRERPCPRRRDLLRQPGRRMVRARGLRHGPGRDGARRDPSPGPPVGRSARGTGRRGLASRNRTPGIIEGPARRPCGTGPASTAREMTSDERGRSPGRQRRAGDHARG